MAAFLVEVAGVACPERVRDKVFSFGARRVEGNPQSALLSFFGSSLSVESRVAEPMLASGVAHSKQASPAIG